MNKFLFYFIEFVLDFVIVALLPFTIVTLVFETVNPPAAYTLQGIINIKLNINNINFFII